MADPIDPEFADQLAAEHALGVLDGEARLRALALQRSDPGFAAAVEQWQVRLSPLLREVEAMEPSERVWQRTIARIDGANDERWPRRAHRWRAATFVTGAVAASLAAVVVVGPREQAPAPTPTAAPAPTPRHVAQLVDPQGKPILAIAYDRTSGTMKVGASTLGGEGRVPELWIVPEGGAPHSLGELTVDGSTRVIPPAALQRLVRDGATLAITLERRDGIPHAAPTSAIIASGTLTSI